ncbi:3728_t:CDS:10 [Funneliformis caledonium]|uniref:3728_t:CDS:1 n=1 Tax=Funneliformis caledonium TaxID=1117310 RepID=A0A9N9G4B5_9GLOM|nr:3728_t:CDS:10 [Funneliformis caledonium]
MYIHEYFSIARFLNECNEEPFRFKVDIYLKSLVNIINSDQGKKREKAQALFDKYKMASSSPFRSFNRATRPVLGHRQPFSLAIVKSLLVDLALVPFEHRQPFSLADEPKPDHELAMNGLINVAYVTGGTVGAVSGTGNISGGTFGVELFASKKEIKRKQARIDSENLQPIYNIQIPPPRVVTSPHPPRTPEHQIFSSSSMVSPITRNESDEETDNDFDFDADNRDDSITFDERGEDNSYMFREINISALFSSYRVNEFIPHSAIAGRQLLRPSIQEFSRDTLELLQKNMRNSYAVKTKVLPNIALDEDLSLEDAEKAIEGSFAKSFQDTTDQKKFEIMRFIFLQLVRNIPINPLNDHLSEGTLTVNIISLILRSFFHNATIHPSIWPNTASMSAKVCKLANFDSSRAKQLDMISNIVNNNKSSYEMMFRKITGEGKNNKAKKNNLDLIKLGVFMKDALDILVKKIGKDRIVFSWQSIVTSWTGYIMVLVTPGLYIMINFINGIDNLFTFAKKYKCEVKRTRDDINRMKEQKKDDSSIGAIKWCQATLGTSRFKKLVKRT